MPSSSIVRSRGVDCMPAICRLWTNPLVNAATETWLRGTGGLDGREDLRRRRRADRLVRVVPAIGARDRDLGDVLLRVEEWAGIDRPRARHQLLPLREVREERRELEPDAEARRAGLGRRDQVRLEERPVVAEPERHVRRRD